MSEEKSVEEGRVYIIRMAGSTPDVAEYLLGTTTGNTKKKGAELKDVIRVLCRLLPKKGFKQTPDGGVQEEITMVKSWEFYTDDHFTDHSTLIHSSSIMMSREVGEEEDLYKNYIRAVEDYVDQKASMEAKKIAEDKVREIKEKRGKNKQDNASH